MAEAPLSSATLIALLRQMGHDIRAPLGSMISTSDMLLEGTYDTLTEKQMRAAKRLSRSSRRALAIIDDFNTYIKAEAAEIVPMPKVFAPRECLTEWLTQVRQDSQEKELNYELVIDSNVPFQLTGDNVIISRIVLALLWNAVAFTPHGTIRLESSWLNGQEWLIHVKDTGLGIRAEDVPHIFEPFYRGEARPQVPTAGVGLGLAVSSALTKLMHGQLSLKETGVQGSTFFVCFPLMVIH